MADFEKYMLVLPFTFSFLKSICFFPVQITSGKSIPDEQPEQKILLTAIPYQKTSKGTNKKLL